MLVLLSTFFHNKSHVSVYISILFVDISFCFLVLVRVFLYHPSWPGTYYVDQPGCLPTHNDPPTSPSQMLGLKAFTTIPS